MTFSASLVAVGDENSKKGEKFQDGTWSDIQEPPIDVLTDRDAYRLAGYAVIFHGGYHYYFGGLDGNSESNSILRLSGTSWTWSNVGQLNSAREGHSAILIGNTVTVLGGYGTKRNEACSIDNEQINCTYLSSGLAWYWWYPILHSVDQDYGQC